MKKTFLRSAAIAVAVTGASAAHAVHVNPDGLGQVLLYPYYTVQNNFVTAVHVVNTTDMAKAVKVRFLEGKNSREVLDFNLYLSPHDVWTGTVVRDDANGAKLISTDKSCTVPAIPAAGAGFRNFDFATDPLSGDVNRRREGYVEMIEMGEIDPTSPIGLAATHGASGVPANCSTIRSADASTAGILVSAPGGGLFGSGHLVSVDGGVRTSYEPTALDDFNDLPTGIWHVSGDTAPSLEDVSTDGVILDGAAVVPFVTAATRPPIDAVSAVLAHDTISNEYTVDAGRLSQTDWVMTFPTKRFYVSKTDPSPFQRPWVAGTADAPFLKACHDVSFDFYDREEGHSTPSEGDFSPPPPTQTFGLCTEVNTLTVHRAGADLSAAKLFGAVSTSNTLAVDNFEAGWMSVTFGVNAATGTGQLVDDTGVTVTGLPVIGFSASRNVNTVDVQIDGLNVYSAVMGEKCP